MAGFCSGCAAEFPRVADPCRICGLPRPVGRCPRDAGGWYLDRTRAPYEYVYPLDYYLQALKFGHGRSLGRALALLLLPWIDSREIADAILVPVPLHPRRLRERGYNQATEIARTLATELGLSFTVAGIRRPRPVPAQSSLGAQDRRANVAGAFRVERELHGRRIVIVDDVVTTGATVNALAGVLRAAGAADVSALAVARTL